MIPDAYAITYTAVADGIWYDDATWGKSNPGNPNSDDEVIIPDGIIVTLTKDVTNDGTITVDGELDLSASKITNTESGIVDVNNYLIIGNSGTLENDKGTININEGGDGILISAGGLLENKNSISVLNIGNSFIDNYGTISNTGTIQCISNTEPEINNFGTITNNGGAILGNSANFYLYNEGGTITNDGTITATIEQYGASLFTNQNSGIIIDDSDDSYIENNGGTFDNDGTIHVGDFNNNFIFENHGTLILNNFFNGEAGTTFTTFSGSTSTINRFENTATITNGGVFSTNVGSLNYGTIVNDGTFTNAGTFGNFGPFTNNGTFEQKATVGKSVV